MKKYFVGWAGIVLITLACGLTSPAASTQPSVETIVAATVQAFTPVAPATQTPPSGTLVAVNNISFTIPIGIGGGAQAEAIAAVPSSNDVPWWEIGPNYDKYLIQNYLLPETFHEPTVYVYPVTEYIQVNPDIAGLIDELNSIINTQGQPLPENLPFLPAFNAAQVFVSNEQLVKFQNGSGIRYLTQFDQAPAPINNHEVFYTFQGITTDGKYYVSAILPVNVSFLPGYASPEYPVPPDGIPFDWDNYENTQAYFDAVKQKLNSTDPNSFTPSLLNLDTLIQSINVNSQ